MESAADAFAFATASSGCGFQPFQPIRPLFKSLTAAVVHNSGAPMILRHNITILNTITLHHWGIARGIWELFGLNSGAAMITSLQLPSRRQLPSDLHSHFDWTCVHLRFCRQIGKSGTVAIRILSYIFSEKFCFIFLSPRCIFTFRYRCVL